MQRLVALRGAEAVIVLIGVVTFAFFITRISGDPVQLLAGPEATPHDIAVLRKAYGFDKPLFVQYVRYVEHAARGNFGASLRYNVSALRLVGERLPATAELTAGALVLSVTGGLLLGIVAATHPRSLWDHLSILVALAGQAVPVFWLGILLILLFPLRLGLFYTSGYGGLGHLVLPAMTLGLFHMARLARLTRGTLLDVLASDYVRTATSKGLSHWRVLWHHALRNGMLPLLSIIGLDVGKLLGGAVVTETIFAWPGVGQLAVQSVFARDYPVVQVVVLIASLLFVATNLVVDLMCTTSRSARPWASTTNCCSAWPPSTRSWPSNRARRASTT